MNKNLMKLMVECPGTYRQVHLSDPQLDLFEHVRRGDCVLSRNVAEAFGISIQSASLRLNQLFKKGYLIRHAVASESGGIEYQYRAVDLEQEQ